MQIQQGVMLHKIKVEGVECRRIIQDNTFHLMESECFTKENNR